MAIGIGRARVQAARHIHGQTHDGSGSQKMVLVVDDHVRNVQLTTVAVGIGDIHDEINGSSPDGGLATTGPIASDGDRVGTMGIAAASRWISANDNRTREHHKAHKKPEN